ncbi:hypothetical protein CYMTET_17197 [Cymbomonas tetramitiformis]|uniref:Uncharacterized protein n=1 Tax=Cymbomonas tetramitiformis TaxID=36881 RepID=A0AAE0GAD5_9CHLO|nr:hypothetical protein CYMTET_17197 [Cymbomonas tetramitiformis]
MADAAVEDPPSAEKALLPELPELLLASVISDLGIPTSVLSTDSVVAAFQKQFVFNSASLLSFYDDRLIDAQHMALYKNLHQEVSTESGKLPSIFWSKVESKLDPFAIRPATLLSDSAEHAAKKPRLSESPSVTGSDATKASQFSKQFKQAKTCNIPWSFKDMNALAADKSGYAHFYNSEQMRIFMYHQHMPKPERDREVNRRWNIKTAPSDTNFAITKKNGINAYYPQLKVA